MNKLSSAFVGGLIAVMILLNGTLGNAIGNYAAAVVIHAVGLIGIILILFISKSKVKFYKSVPVYAYTAGLIGVMPIIFNNVGFNYLGVSLTLTLGMFGQSLTSIVVDHFGLLGMPVVKFNKKKIIGLAIITTGMIIMTVY